MNLIEHSRHAELDSASHIYVFSIINVCEMLKTGYVYIMTNEWRTTFYIGVTGDLAKRVSEHKSGAGSEFTTKYSLTELVYYERIHGMKQAINREKQLKRWRREWKIELIKKANPEMKDLSQTGLEWLS